jgi:integrase
LTFAEYLDQWLANYAKGNVAPKTFERWEEICKKHLAIHLGAIAIKNLSALAIQAYYTEASKSGRRDGKGGLAPRTVHHHHRVLYQALKHAVRWRLIARNPAEDVDPPKAERTKIEVLDIEGVGKLLATTKGSRLHTPSLLAVTTGMRRGEVLGLHWSDVDLDAARLTINWSLEETKAGGLRLKKPKSKAGCRTITLSPLTVDALHRHKVQQMEERLQLGLGRNDDGLVFTNIDGEPRKPRNFSKEFDRIVGKAGIKRITFHGLRHTHITQLLKDGEHIKVVSERAGHSSVAITLDLYGHVVPGMQEDAALKVDAAWGKALQE